MFDLILYIPVNNLSVTSGRVFLGWTSTKLGLMCLAQEHNAVTPQDPCPFSLKSSLYHWATALPKELLVTDILIHLKMQRDIWLDNVINLRQYILWYTVANPTSLRNITFHWLASEYIQLASSFMQLAYRCNKVLFHCLFERKMLIVHSDFIWPFLRPYMGVIPNPKMAFIFPISCILALIFPILIKYFPKCVGKGSFPKSKIKSLVH